MTPVALVKLGNATYKVYIEWWRDNETNEWFVRKVMVSHWKAGKASCAFFCFYFAIVFLLLSSWGPCNSRRGAGA